MDYQKGPVPTHMQSDILYIEDDSNSTLSLSKKLCRSKKSHEMQNRKVKLKKNNNRETLIITQKVKVKKQKIQCILNLTNVYKYEEAWRSKYCLEKLKHLKTSLKTHSETKSPKICLKEHATPNSSRKLNVNSCVKPKKSLKVDLSAKVERIVPHCLRNRCQPTKSSKQQIGKERSKSRKYSKHYSENKKYGADVSKEHHRLQSPITVSSCQLSPELEDISSDSFTLCSEDHLDTLIKRTKDRERRLSKTFEFKSPLRSSMPKHVEASDTETLHIRSEGDTSINSVSTFILEPQLNADRDLYSPTCPMKSLEIEENIFDTFKCFKSQEYSPAIDSQIYERNAKTECNDCLTIKMEAEKNLCSMDISNPIKSYENRDIKNFIKWTKDRERRLRKTFEFKSPLRSSTPKQVEASDTETLHIQSEGDTFINSVSTFKLEPQPNADRDLYSPTYPMESLEIEENILDTFKCFKSQEYSPAIGSQIYEGNAKPEWNDAFINKMEVKKNSCSMDISNPIKSYGNGDNKNFLEINEKENTEIGVIEKDLYAYRSPLLIKQENKSSPLC